MDRQRVWCALAASVSSLGALVVRLELGPWLGAHAVFIPFTVPVALSAWCGGWQAGLLALSLSSLLAQMYFQPPGSELAVFLITCLPIIAFSEASRRAVRDSEHRQSQLEESDREKDRMVALLVHELRNPLSSISNAVHLIRIGAADGRDVLPPTDIALRSLTQMGRLIDDLMDVSRISRGRVQLRYQSFDLRELLQTVMPAAEEAAESKGLRLELDAPFPLQVFADSLRISQVFGNLIGNAVKFTDKGWIKVRLDRRDKTAHVTVEDSGIGIAPEVLPHIWEPFRQGSITSSRGGLGLGLSVVKGLVEIHGGTVSAESIVGRGTTFTVDLPLEEGLIKRPRSVTPATNDT